MIKMKRRSNINGWDDVKKEISGFLTFNPKGNLNDLFDMYGNTFRTKYYKFKPKEYTFPNQGTIKTIIKRKKAAPKKPASKGFYKNKHVAAFREACKCDLKTLYMIMHENDLDKTKPPEDWRENKNIYIELMQEAVNNYLNPPQIEIKKEEIKMPKAPIKSKRPAPKPPLDEPESEDKVKKAKIDSLMEIARMIKET